ncbi:FG-GAP repeat domain-containing protein [Thermogemmatispora onikobensis]|uniref:FG-GAP repeat domain-containing protein n=1 Tax=Thermogemmatispora onikobensis TaxID=732234 RepID=UPI000852D94F|nr:VCBS repeat-containing protein [Thermogemmatispora onikobensis]
MNPSHLRREAEVLPLRQPPRSDDELASANHEEDDAFWKEARPTSVVRRYQALVDVKTEVGRARADALPESSLVSARRGTAQRQSEMRTPGPARRRASERQPAPGPTAAPSERARERRTEEPLRPALPSQKTARRYHWLMWLGLFWLTMVVGWVVLSALAGWWQTTLDDWRYGRPRTFQVDAVVGHGDSSANPSHFIALNLNRHVEIIEFPGGDATKARIYVGPVLVGPGQDLAPVTLSFQDVNGDGRPDMVVTIEDSHFFFINENGSFRPARPGEPLRFTSP